ncbi:hypothetical protein BDL97_10G078900 [Sphagnum fallax]|nr:hypothetical protein BDL97_10G078900 [Sphagnum fallax]
MICSQLAIMISYFFNVFFPSETFLGLAFIVFIVLISVYSLYHFVLLFLGVTSLLLFRTSQTIVQVQRYRKSLTTTLEFPPPHPPPSVINLQLRHMMIFVAGFLT